ncbi:hypothetical protein C2E23DRAFT_882795 [Lenzites betulinus]|nr:hypothetical protein C2E23DRAFT_882795 [Lenzites betulinus]
MSRKPTAAEWDAIAACIGPTPRLDEHGHIVPIGKTERKVRYYVVWSGRAVGIFMNWGLVSAMTSGYKGATYKKYTTLEDARVGWEEGPTLWKGKWHPPAPRPPMAAPGAHDPVMPAYTPSRDQSPVRDPSSYKYQSPPDRIQISLPQGEAESPPTDEEYDGDADPHCPPSPSLSSAPFLSGSLTPGTLSPWTVRTPNIPTPSLAAMSIHSPHTSRSPPVLEQPPVKLNARDTARRTGTHGKALGAPSEGDAPSRGVAAFSHASKTAFKPDGVKVPAPKQVFVVVRGDYPGLYLDRNTAMIMLGTNPGMKLVVFDSRSTAAWYFVQEYMAGRVGKPVIVIDGN